MRRRWLFSLMLLTAAAVLAIQLLLPPIYGLADNGDFSKVAGRFSLAPVGAGADNFVYVPGKFQKTPQAYWDAGLPSSELLLAATAVHIVRGDSFDLRSMGAVHGVLWLAAFALVAWTLKELPIWRAAACAGLLIFVLTDVCYTAYFNSFYTDTAAVLGLFAMTGAACVSVVRGGRHRLTAAIFLLAAILFVTSKGQHAIFAVVPAGMALASIAPRWLGAGFALLILIAGILMLRATPADYPSPALFSVIFDKILPSSAAPARDLAELGLDPADARYVRQHAYKPGNPMTDPAWRAQFLRRASYAGVARFYLAHPSRAASILSADLEREAPWNRAPNLGNFRREDGKRPGERAHRFDTWSSFRSALFRWWPAHAIVWYVLVAAGCAAVLFKSKQERLRKMSMLCLLILLLGAGEYMLASLADSCETHRHFLVFHAATDISVCLAALGALAGNLRY